MRTPEPGRGDNTGTETAHVPAGAEARSGHGRTAHAGDGLARAAPTGGEPTGGGLGEGGLGEGGLGGPHAGGGGVAGRHVGGEVARPHAEGGLARPHAAGGGGAGGRGGARWRRGVFAGGVVMVAGLVVGCGIRTTSVPVDAGGAPSRMSCTLPEAAGASAAAQEGVAARVYLVCASGLEAVDRTVVLPAARDVRVATAQALLDALGKRPSERERQAGFATYVEERLTVSAGRAGDPAGALRLSRQPEDLPPAALAQLVCTYAETGTVAVQGAAVLGGPGDYPVRRYVCDRAVKERPESAVPTRAS
ncbi:hypothetical protein [Streptomyces sp. TRM64462]|uniref:hypothetical protein n=1 Tax=Streptomyces sp. TRM64462 TaxID=2741726 RepID=UPI0026773466|nr:hypothetical protein [Streptomyces sp. TRM64462]